jgi:hypothetical protein
MSGIDAKQFVLIQVTQPAAEAEFFARVYNSVAARAGQTEHQVDTGRFMLRFRHADSEAELSRNLEFEVSVDNVNQFAEQVWNRGVKYASRPQNYPDGLRRVRFVSPAEFTITGIGPLKMDSTGAFPSMRPGQ